MLDRLLEFLVQFWDDVSFFCIIHTWERGVKFRGGLWLTDLEPGLHWKWPIYDSWMTDSVVTDTEILEPQPLTTKDDKSVTIRALLKYNIRNLKKLVTEVQDKEKALYDIAAGIIADIVPKKNWEDLNTQEFRDEVCKAIRARGFRYGIEVEEVQFPMLQKMRSYMLVQDKQFNKKEK